MICFYYSGTSNNVNNVKINVNGTGAYQIAAQSNTPYTGKLNTFCGTQNYWMTYIFAYYNNVGYWVWVSRGTDANTTYSGMTTAEIDAGTGTTARLITPANLKYAIETWAPSGGGGALPSKEGSTYYKRGSSTEIFDSNYESVGEARAYVYKLDNGSSRIGVSIDAGGEFATGYNYRTDDTLLSLTKANLTDMFPEAMQAYEDAKSGVSGVGQVIITFKGQNPQYINHNNGTICWADFYIKMQASRYSAGDPWEEYAATCNIYAGFEVTSAGGQSVSVYERDLYWSPTSYSIEVVT